MTLRRAHTRHDPTTGRTVPVRAHPVRTAAGQPPVAPARIRRASARVTTIDPMAAHPAPTVVATHLAGIPSVLSPEEFTDRFVPSEYGPTWASAADIAVRPAHWARGDGQTWEGFVDSVARDGIRQPVQVHDGVWCTDGHHRVVAAMATGTPIPWEPADNPDYDGQIPEGVEDYHRFAVEDGDTDLIDDAAPWDDDWWADVAERRDRNLGVLAYDCRDGTVHITPGVLDEQARAAFLLGGCGASPGGTATVQAGLDLTPDLSGRTGTVVRTTRKYATLRIDGDLYRLPHALLDLDTTPEG